MDAQDVDVIERSIAYQGYFRIDRYRVRHRKHDGGWTGEVVREVFERGHAAAALLYDAERDMVALVDQFRPGALAAGWHPWQLEIVAGIIETGETPEDVARREAREEAGCRVTELIPVCRYLSSPGGTSESCAVYCCRVDTSCLGGIHGMPDEDEDIKVVVVSADEAISMVTDGRIANAVSIIALQWLALNRAELRRRWLVPGQT